MTTANEALRDLALTHRLALNRLTNAAIREALRKIAAIEKRLREELATRLAKIEAAGFDTGPVTTARLKALLRDFRSIHTAAFSELNADLRDAMIELAEFEAELAAIQLGKALPSAIVKRFPVARTTTASLRAIVTSKPFQGRLLRNHIRRIEANSWAGIVKAFESAIGQAIVEGSGPAKAVRAVSKAVLGRAGTIATLTRPQIRTIVRTAIGHVSQAARLATYRTNRGKNGVVKGYLWLSTLDLRTTIQYCIPRDHKPYTLRFSPIGHDLAWSGGPGRIHFNCRSTFMVVLKSWRELGINADEKLPKGTRAAMGGRLPVQTNAETWLRGQLKSPASRSVLVKLWGERRIELYESGRLKLADMVKSDGGLRTIRQLERMFA